MAISVVTYLEKCVPADLVKINVEGIARFALLGEHSNAFIPAFAFLENRCEVFNLSGPFGYAREYDGAFALNFGSDFTIKPLYADCDIGEGGLFRTPGAIVRTPDAEYLVGIASGWRDPMYCDIKTGKRISEPGGIRAAFGGWELYTPENNDSPLIKMQVR